MTTTPDEYRRLAALLGDTAPWDADETFDVLSQAGELLLSVTGPHRYPFPYNIALSRAAAFLPPEGDGTLFISEHGKRMARIVGCQSCHAVTPIEVERKDDPR